MHFLKVDFSIVTINKSQCLSMRIMEADYDVLDISALFSEVAESIIGSTYMCFCFDLSALALVNSTVFGACINIANAAKKVGKHVKFKFNSDAMEVAVAMSLNQFMEIEEVKASGS